VEYKDKHILVSKYNKFQQEIILFEDEPDMMPVTLILPEPPNKNKIINHSRATANQKWERIPLPEHFAKFKRMPKDDIYKKLTSEDHKFILGEYEKFDAGFWFMNNGQLTYISGHNYLFLNYWNIDGITPEYRNPQRLKFLHWDKIEKDPNCFGMVEMTNRRAGKSAIAGCLGFARTFTNHNHNTGIQSKTNEDGKAFLQRAVVAPWRKLPFFMQPVFDNTSNPREEIRFFSPAIRGKNAAIDGFAVEDELESLITVRSSDEKAFDGYPLHTSICDEVGKTNPKEADVYKRWEVKKFCLVIGNTIRGKAMLTTTVEDMEEGGQQFVDIWNESHKSTIDPKTGRTKSGLHQHFTPAYEGLDGFVDEYGNSKVEEAKEFIANMFASAKGNPSKLISLKRKMPRTVAEAISASSKECQFNVEILDSRIEQFIYGNKHLARGNFRWKDNQRDTEVVFEPTPKGRWLVSYQFEESSMANRFNIVGGKKVPGNMSRFVAGADPYKFDETSGKRKSEGAGAVFMKQDHTIDPDSRDVSEWVTNCFVASYLFRPESKNDYGEDMLMMCHYYGCQMNPEINVSFLWDYFVERGYVKYLYFRKDARNKTVNTPGYHTNDGTKDTIFSEFETYIQYHGAREKHDEILKACREVDYKNLNPADLFVASGYALIAARNGVKIQETKRETKNELFETFYL
jgi:hypothetical protein